MSRHYVHTYKTCLAILANHNLSEITEGSQVAINGGGLGKCLCFKQHEEKTALEGGISDGYSTAFPCFEAV